MVFGDVGAKIEQMQSPLRAKLVTVSKAEDAARAEGALRDLADRHQAPAMEGAGLFLGDRRVAAAQDRRVAKTDAVRLLVAQIDTLAASGGYMVTVAADRIVARQSSIVGSIGVIVQYPNFTGLLENWGVDVRAIKSTPLKAEPSFFGEPPEGAEEMLRALVMDSFDWFKELVAERRGFDQATIDRLADGSVYSGRVSLANGLVDELGGEDAARAWLTAQGIDEDLKIVRWEPRREDSGLFGLGIAAEFVAGRIGLSNPASSVTKALNQRLFLDGLISLWHADALLTSPTAEP